MKLKYYIFVNIILSMITVASCTKIETASDDLNLLKVNEATTTSSLYDVQIFSKDPLFVGYNKVYLKVKGLFTATSPLTSGALYLSNLSTFYFYVP